MFSTQGAKPVTRTAGFNCAEGPHGAQHRGRAGHVVLHLLHALGGLDRDAAAVERDALAHQRQVVGGRVFGARGGRGWNVFQNDQARRLDGALRDAQQRPESKLFHPRLVQHLALQPLLSGHAAGVVGQDARRHQVGRLVDQRAGVVLGFPNHAPALQRLLERRRLFRHRDAHALDALLALLGIGFVDVGLEIAQQKALGQRLDHLLRHQLAFQRQADVRDPLVLQRAQRRAGQLPRLGRAEPGPLAAPGQQQPRRLEPRRAVQERCFQRLASELLGGVNLPDPSVGPGVQAGRNSLRRGGRAVAGVFAAIVAARETQCDQCAALEFGGGRRSECDLHVDWSWSDRSYPCLSSCHP